VGQATVVAVGSKCAQCQEPKRTEHERLEDFEPTNARCASCSSSKGSL
jgi:bacterioferritin-associated ferredoxin